MAPFRVLRQKKYDMQEIFENQLILNFASELAPTRGEINSIHENKTGSWYLLGVLFKISDERPHFFHMTAPPPPDHYTPKRAFITAYRCPLRHLS